MDRDAGAKEACEFVKNSTSSPATWRLTRRLRRSSSRHDWRAWRSPLPLRTERYGVIGHHNEYDTLIA